MFYKKVFAGVLCLLLAAMQIPAQQNKTEDVKKPVVSAELQEKALNLLNALAREAEQFYLAENRVKARILIADLMWEHDEKQARAIFQNAVTDLNTMIGQLPPSNEENAESMYTELNPIKELRSELLMILASRDPKAALDAMQALTAKNAEGENLFTEDQTLELSIASEIVEKDPKQAYELARKNLEINMEYSLFSTLESIYEKDAELGARLAKDIIAKIKSRKVSSPYEYGSSNTNTNSRSNSTSADASPIGTWQVQAFLDSTKKLNRRGAKDNKTPALGESDLKEMVEILSPK